MPICRSTTLAHSSPPKTVRATPPPRSSVDLAPEPFWDAAKMSRLNAALARKKGRSREASLWSCETAAELSCGDFTSYSTAVPHAQLPRFVAPSLSVRESRSPSISAAHTGLSVDEHAHKMVSRASAGLLSSPEDGEAWSVRGTGGAFRGDGGGLSVSAPRALSCLSSSCGSASAGGGAAWRDDSVRAVPATAAAAREGSSVLPGSSSSVARAAQRMRHTGRGTVSTPRTTRAFERTEHPRLGQSPLRCVPPTARARLVALPVAAASLVVSPRAVPTEAAVLVHTPRIRQPIATASKKKTKTVSAKTKKSKHHRKGEVGITTARGSQPRASVLATVPPPPADDRRRHITASLTSSRPRAEPRVRREGATTKARSTSPAPCPPQTSARQIAAKTSSDSCAASTVMPERLGHSVPSTVHAPSSSTTRSPSVPATHDSIKLEKHDVVCLEAQAAALRHEVRQLEAARRELQSTVAVLVGQIGDAAREMDEVEQAQQKRALASERMIRSVVADWALQQNAMVERLALMEEEMMGL